MNLHRDEHLGILAEAVRLTAAEFNVPQSYVEKDYFLTNALLHLSRSEHRNNVVFKGGTSLSKVYKCIYRFSEDIDLAIIPGPDWSGAKITRVIKSAITSAAEGLTASDVKFTNGSKFRKERYTFPRINSHEALGEVQDSILFECNAFTTPSPAILKDIRSLIAEWAIRNENLKFIADYELHDFQILVLCWKRTFCEKILGLMAAASRDELSNKVRHFYDLVVLFREDDILKFVSSDDFYQMMSITVQNDINHAGNQQQPWINADMGANPPFSEFDAAWEKVEAAYNGDFQQMVTRQELNPTTVEIAQVFDILRLRLTTYSKTPLHQECLTTIKAINPPPVLPEPSAAPVESGS